MKKHFVDNAKSFGARKTVVRAITAALMLALLGTAGCGKKTPAADTTVAESRVIVEESSAEPEESVAASEEASEEASSEAEESEAETEESEEAEVSEEEEESREVLKNTTGKLVNGNFASDIDYYTLYAIDENSMYYTVNNKVLNITISDTGTEDWHVQLKQDGIKLVNGKWYQLTLQAKSTLARNIGCAMQRDGSADNNWALYSNSERLALTGKWQTYTITFQMNEKTDKNALFNLSLGTVDGAHLTKEHTVSLKNISLKTLDDNWMESLKKDGNLLGNTDFAYGNTLWETGINGSAKGSISLKDGKATFDISNVGDLDWHVQMKQLGVNLKQNTGYRLTFKVSSTADRTIKIGFMDLDYVIWYGGGDVTVGPAEKTATVEFYNTNGDNANAQLMISMGKIEGVNTPVSKIVLSDLKLEEVPGMSAPSYGGGGNGGSVAAANLPEGWSANCAASNGSMTYADGTFTTVVNNPGTNEWDVQLKKNDIVLEKGEKYRVKFTVTSTASRVVKLGFLHATTYDWYGGTDITLTANEPQEIVYEFTMDKATNEHAYMQLSMGQMYKDQQYTDPYDTPASTITVSDYTFEKLEKPAAGSALIDATIVKKGANYGFTYGSFLDEVKIGDTVVLKARFSGELDYWSGCFGGCDVSDWNQVEFNKDNNEVTLTLTVPSTDDGWPNTYAEAQLWYPEADTDANVRFELLSVEKQDAASDPSAPAEPLLTGTIVNQDQKISFFYAEYVEDLQVGDSVTLTARFTSENYGWGGGFGGSDGRAENNYWKQVEFKDSVTEVSLELVVGTNENGVMNPYAQAELWWPETKDNDAVNVKFELLSVTKTNS